MENKKTIVEENVIEKKKIKIDEEESRQEQPLHMALISLTKLSNLNKQPLGLLGKQQSL